MPATSFAVIIASLHGRSGKTLLARLIAESYLMSGGSPMLFDTDAVDRPLRAIVLSGDRHVGAIYRETAGVAYPLIEITSSGLNRDFPGNREPGLNRLGGVYGAVNFGTIDVDWWEGRVTVSVRGQNRAHGEI